jgi:hypothetical protein
MSKATLLTDAGVIKNETTNSANTATRVGEMFEDIINESLIPTYKVYRALLTQTGTSAPVATVLENTLGATPTYARDGVGVYTLTSVGSFPANKTIVNFPRGYWNLFGGSILTEQRMAVYRDSSSDGEDVIYFYTAIDDTATDGVMTLTYGDNWWIEIIVYD